MNKKPIVNYIIGGWLAGRRSGVIGGLDLADWHLKQLNKLKHNLQKIYYVMPSAGFDKTIYSVVEKYPKLNIEVMVMKENKFSHGSWNYCLHKTCDEADFTICVEDDYIPVIDDIDKVFLEYFDDDKVGYVCQQQIELPTKLPRLGAALENGMLRNKAFKEYGGFKIVVNSYYGASLTQACFLKYIVEGGYTIRDTMDKYQAFYNRSGRVSLYGNRNGPHIFKPIECLLWDCDEYIKQEEKPYIQEVTPLKHD